MDLLKKTLEPSHPSVLDVAFAQTNSNLPPRISLVTLLVLGVGEDNLTKPAQLDRPNTNS